MPAGPETPDAEREIVRADKRLRVWVILAAVLLTVAGLVVIGVLHARLQQMEKQAGENLQAAREKAIGLTTTVAWVGGLGFVGMGAWFWRLGRRINRAGRFPPPGMKVIKDILVRTGPKARTLANLAQLAALLCVVVGTMGMWYLYRLAVTVSR